MTVQPYLFFDGKCEEAIEFYKKALDAKVEMMMRFKENPEPPKPGDENCAGPMPTAAMAEKIMHAAFKVGDSLVMASDGMCQGKPSFQGISLSLTVKTEAEADKRFAALADGGQVQMPLGKTFFSPKFGMVADKFGVSWMVIVG
jgi:PhnB protein